VEWLTLDAQGEAVTLAPEELGATAYAGAPTWSRWETAPGRCRCVAVRETPYWVQALWEVPGFGRVWLTADRDGDGWSEEGGPLVLLPLAFARTQLRRAQARAAQLVQQGEAAPLQAQERLTSAARVLEQAETASTPAEQARAAHAALADALWAGEVSCWRRRSERSHAWLRSAGRVCGWAARHFAWLRCRQSSAPCSSTCSPP